MTPLVNILLTFIVVITLNVGGIKTAGADSPPSSGSFEQQFDYNHPLGYSAAETQRLPTPVKQRNAERKQQLSSSGGVTSTVGTLAIGGLFGALFFGGAFEHINIFDVILFSIMAIVLLKFAAPKNNKRKQRRPTAASASINSDGTASFPTPTNHYRELAEADVPSHTGPSDVRRNGDRTFEDAAFVDGAENLFRRLQKAWDEGDLADIRQFTTDHVFAEIQDQYHQRTNKTSTKIVTLKAELLNTSHLDLKQEAIVLFEAQLNEAKSITYVNEVWHFTRPTNSTQSTWFLDGIQQVQ